VERGLLEHVRGERLIATGRVLLALFTLAVVYLDPDVGFPRRLLPIAAAFAVYAVLLSLFCWRAPMIAVRGRLAVHVIDFLVFSLFIELSHASVSPFFVFVLFSLLAALVRFAVKGMLVTAAAAIATYVVMAATDDHLRSDPGYLIMRATSLGVATFLLAYLGAYHERMRKELTKLAAWPVVGSEQSEVAIRETLQLARDLMSVPRVLLAWEEEEEPWVLAAMLDGERFSVTRERPRFLETLVNDTALDATFFERDDTAVLVRQGKTRRAQGSPLTSVGRQRFRVTTVLSAPVHGQMIHGRIFFFDRDDFQIDDIAVVEIVARLVAARLDQLNVATRTRAAAVAQERLRVARDLHDGFLQSLTGAALQLEMTNRLIDSDPAAARERLRNVQELIAADQRELRALISGLRPDSRPPRPMLGNRLEELAERFRRQWDVDVTIRMEPPIPDLPDHLASEIYNIVSEGAVNAAKHAGASHIDVELQVTPEDVAMIVADDGKGFPFTGTYTLEQLDHQRRGPVTLKERVTALGGRLVLHSTRQGSRVEIRIDRAAVAT
jgi:signal transduction histidine kinase